jgi:hypothetical protein
VRRVRAAGRSSGHGPRRPRRSRKWKLCSSGGVQPRSHLLDRGSGPSVRAEAAAVFTITPRPAARCPVDDQLADTRSGPRPRLRSCGRRGRAWSASAPGREIDGGYGRRPGFDLDATSGSTLTE